MADMRADEAAFRAEAGKRFTVVRAARGVSHDVAPSPPPPRPTEARDTPVHAAEAPRTPPYSIPAPEPPCGACGPCGFYAHARLKGGAPPCDAWSRALFTAHNKALLPRALELRYDAARAAACELGRCAKGVFTALSYACAREPSGAWPLRGEGNTILLLFPSPEAMVVHRERFVRLVPECTAAVCGTAPQLAWCTHGEGAMHHRGGQGDTKKTCARCLCYKSAEAEAEAQAAAAAATTMTGMVCSGQASSRTAAGTKRSRQATAREAKRSRHAAASPDS